VGTFSATLTAFGNQVITASDSVASALTGKKAIAVNPYSMIASNKGAASVSVLLGNGNGNFGAKTDFTVGTNPEGMAFGDVNNDGIPDLVTANSGTTTVSVLLSNGNGTFGAKTDFTVGTLPKQVAIVDVNADGIMDLVVTNQTSNTVSVLLGNNNGTFQAKTDFTATAARGLAVVDVNSDSKADIVVAGNNSFVHVLLSNGNGTFQAQQNFGIGSSPNAAVAVADVNGDGFMDIVAANFTTNNVSILLGNNNGTFGAATNFADGSGGPYWAMFADINGDGKQDIVTGDTRSGQNTTSILLGNGNGTFQARQTFTTGAQPYGLAVADINGDGKLDIVIANTGAGANTASVLLGNGNGTFAAKTDFTTAADAEHIILGSVWTTNAPQFIPTAGGFYIEPYFLGQGQSLEVLRIGGIIPGIYTPDGIQFLSIPITYTTTGRFSANAVPSVTSAGSGYAVNDTVTLTGGVTGTGGGQIILKVLSLTGSGVATVSLLYGGSYSTKPTDAVAQGSSSGSGTGATFTFGSNYSTHICRDPSLYINTALPGGVGPILVVHTYGSSGIGYLSSGIDVGTCSDGTNFTFLATIPGPQSPVPAICGGPCWYFDPNGDGTLWGATSALHVFFESWNDSSFTVGQIWETHATNSAFTTWSTPVQITGDANFPTSPVDISITYANSFYWLFTRRYDNNSANDFMCIYKCATLTGSYTTAYTGASALHGQTLALHAWESPDIRKDLAGTNWHLYMDAFPGGTNGSCINLFTQAIGATDFTGTNAANWTLQGPVVVPDTSAPRAARGWIVP
jgi:hypothetical protein